MSKPEANKQPQLNHEFIQQIDGKDFVTYQGLLDLAHQRGCKRRYPGAAVPQ